MKFLSALLSLTLIFSTACNVEKPEKQAEQKPMTEIKEEHTWNLKDLYPTVEAFLEEREAFESHIDDILQYKGKLGKSAQTMKACFDMYASMSKTYARMSSYASMNADQNLSDTDAQKLKAETGNIGRKFSQNTSYITPEILSLGEKKIRQFMSKEKGLDLYKMHLNEIIRTSKHTLTEKEEKLMSQTSMLSSTPYKVYSIYTNTEMKFPEITLKNGEKVELNQAMYGKYRTSPDKEDRETVFKNFFGAYKDNENTLGTILYQNLMSDWFYAENRNYSSCVERALDRNNVPVDVYTQLVKDINNNLDSLHRYLKLRKRMMGIDTLKYSDLYPSLVKSVNIEYPIDECKTLLKEAMIPMGEEYIKALEEGMNNRWMDIYPKKGKRSGAYSNGSAYDVHPYVLLNHNDDYDGLSTFAHEFGHALHSYFSNKYQEYANSDYSIFVAEVASTFNENMLNHYLVEKETNPEIKMFLLGNSLERVRTTIFRQAMFAEFELKTHQMVEEGKALTGESFSELYLKLVRKYYGHADGICQVDDLFGVEWAFIPHFYYNFYVYQYSTGLIAATALSENVINEGDVAAERHMNFLKSGSSDYPIDILAKAGADLRTSVPFETTMKAFNKTMDQIEAILDSMEK